MQNARKRQECPKRYFTAKNVPCQAIFRAFMAFMVLFFPISQQTGKKVSSSCLIDLSARWYDTFVQCSRAAQGFRLRRGDSPCSEKVKPHRCSVKGLHWGQPHCHWSYPQFIHFSSPNHSQIHHFIPSPVRRKTRRKGTFRHIVLRGERSCHLGQAPKNVYAQK